MFLKLIILKAPPPLMCIDVLSACLSVYITPIEFRRGYHDPDLLWIVVSQCVGMPVVKLGPLKSIQCSLLSNLSRTFSFLYHGKNHICSRNVLFGILSIVHQCTFFSGNTYVLIGIHIKEPSSLNCFLPHRSCQFGAVLCLPSLSKMPQRPCLFKCYLVFLFLKTGSYFVFLASLRLVKSSEILHSF